MTQPVKNACTPSTIYGGFPHTLFLGCSVMSFSATVGWNEQISEVTVQLVEDPCTAPAESPKHYWDADLNPQTTTAADPGFIGTKEMIGAPMYFRVSNFEFCGILQDYEAHSGVGNRPTYTVKIVSPQLILEGVQLIVGEYSGATSAVSNLYNPFGYLESFGIACPLTTFNGATFGTLAGGFGGSGRNTNGMAWNDIARAFNILCNATTTVGAAWGGGKVNYRGYTYANTVAVGGYGLIPGYQYFVDISEIPATPSYYRIEGPSVGLLEVISQVCEESGYDYYVELIPLQDAVLDLGTGIAKFIKFRTVSRAVAPTVGAISSFIGARASELGSASSDGLMNAADGFELRNEVTSTFYFGSNTETVYQNVGSEAVNCDQSDVILPYWGLDSNKNFILSCKDEDGWWYFDAETEKINMQLQVLSLPASVQINEKELIFAAAGYDEWNSYEMLANATGNGHDIGQALAQQIAGYSGGLHNFAPILAWLAGIKEAALPRDFINTRINLQIDTAISGNNAKVLTDIQKIYEWLNNFATEFYGKKFAVRVPYTCATTDSESALVVNSELPQGEGWTDETTILSLPTDSIPMQFFRGDNGKYQSFCSVNLTDKVIGVTTLDETNYAIYNNILYIKSSIEGEDWVYGDYSNRLYPRAVVVLSQAVKFPSYDDLDEAASKPENVRGLRWLLEQLAGIQGVDFEGFCANPGAVLMNSVLPYKAYHIDGASFGVKSNIHVYGPWGSAGPAGKVRVVQDTGLNPWSFNGTDPMNTAGNALAGEGVTNMQYGEKGSAQVPGYPIIPLGAELGAYDGGFFGVGAGTSLIENRSASTDSWTGDHIDDGSTTYYWGYFDYGAQWTGLYGPSVTNISVQLGDSGVNTSYTFSTFTPKFGRFVKYNADRLRQIGRNKLRAQKNIAATFINQLRIQFKDAQRNDRRRQLIRAKKQMPASPTEVFVSQIKTYPKGGIPGNEVIRRTGVTNETMSDASVSASRDNWGHQAMMSIDGLIRPVSMDGDGGFPRYSSYSAKCDNSQSQGALPPVFEGDAFCNANGGPWYGGDTNTWNSITQDYMNPFSNPAGFSRSDVTTNKSDDTSIGHDVDICARGATPPPTGFSMPIWTGWQGTIHADYQDDYRIFALKGPILLHQWGYDLDGKPIPNKADSESQASGGNFETTSLEYKFMDGWLCKPHSWPVGPIDLRWDRERGVWTAPPERRRILVTLCDNLCPGGSVGAEVHTSQYNAATITDKDGASIANPIIPVVEKHDNCYKSGSKVTAYYDPYNCDYRVLEGHGQYYEIINECWEDEDVAAENVPTVYHTLRFGYGLNARTGEDCCELELCAGILVDKSGDQCLSPTGTFSQKFINDLSLGGGLTIASEGTCKAIMQAGIHFSCEDSGSMPTSCSVVSTDYKFNVGLDSSKFAAADDGDCGILLSIKDDIPASMTVGGTAGVTSIVAGNGITIEVTDGVATISLT